MGCLFRLASCDNGQVVEQCMHMMLAAAQSLIFSDVIWNNLHSSLSENTQPVPTLTRQCQLQQSEKQIETLCFCFIFYCLFSTFSKIFCSALWSKGRESNVVALLQKKVNITRITLHYWISSLAGHSLWLFVVWGSQSVSLTFNFKLFL